MSTSAAQPSPAALPRSGPSAGRVLSLVVGSLLALIAAAMLVGGLAMVLAHLTQRDDNGFYTSSTTRLATSTFALTGEGIDLGDVHDGMMGFTVEDLNARTRIRATAADGGPLFVGIARERDVDAYLRGVAHDEVRDVNHHHALSADYLRRTGTRRPASPASQRFWVASTSGSGTRTLEWTARSGRWSAVVMNADGSRRVAADVNVGVKLGFLLWVGIALLAGGFLVAGGAAALIVGGTRSGGAGGAPVAATPGGPVVETGGATADTASGMIAATTVVPAHPVDVRAQLDEPLSRWLWLVKWFLAIPHFIILCFLWIAFVTLTVVALFAIVFTGRYPRGIFDFNVGVLRWSWRVGYYATAALGTDRYPPITLRSTDYPADLDIPYPERLSRGKALVKWWLLALPHYAILAAFFGWWNAAWTIGDSAVQPPGLLGVLVLVAGVVLLFTGRYPRDVFELVVGIARWTVRVVAYAALMRDEYPPFRLRS